MAITLTERDIDIIRYIAGRRIALIRTIAELYFAVDPFDELPNADPEKACARRLKALACAGYVRTRVELDGRSRRRVVQLAHAAERIVDVRVERRRVPARNRAHHIRTQDALAHVERRVFAGGGRVLSARLEQDVRAQAQRGRRTRRGDQFPAFPDAVCTAELLRSDGTAHTVEIAVEYVTSKYTDADIRAKHASFAQYGAALWYADNARTAARVQRLTGFPCAVLS